MDFGSRNWHLLFPVFHETTVGHPSANASANPNMSRKVPVNTILNLVRLVGGCQQEDQARRAMEATASLSVDLMTTGIKLGLVGS